MMSFVLGLVLFLSLTVVSVVADPDMIYIDVNSENEMMEFYNSTQFNPNLRYTITYPNPRQPRILCPMCGYNTYKGYIQNVEGHVYIKTCPTMAALEGDILVEVKTYTYSACITCGYQTSKYYQGTKYRVSCNFGPSYWARPGQTVAAGYDWHECFSTWGF